MYVCEIHSSLQTWNMKTISRTVYKCQYCKQQDIIYKLNFLNVCVWSTTLQFLIFDGGK